MVNSNRALAIAHALSLIRRECAGCAELAAVADLIDKAIIELAQAITLREGESDRNAEAVSGFVPQAGRREV